jgi:glutathione S-transferase
MTFVNATLEKGPYLLGEEFSAADILVGTTFALFLGGALLPKTPLLDGYVTRILERPAYARAQAKDAG